MKFIDLTGLRFAYWTVIKQSHNLDGRPGWLCRCKCGVERTVRGTPLRSGASKSCGCMIVEKSTTHSLHRHPVYPIWQAMIQRCTNSNAKNFHRYGGRGILVDSRWLGADGFPNFLSDMGDRPDGYTLERRNNDGNYTPDNCYWATRPEQYNNRSTNRLITFRNESMTITEWSKRIGIKPPNLYFRLKNWPIDRALTEPPNIKYGRRSAR